MREHRARSARYCLFALCLSVAASAWAAGGDLAGGWQGTWTRGGDALPVTLSFTQAGDGYSGSFDSDALQVTGIPFSAVSDSAGKVHYELKGDQSTLRFDGSIAGDAMSGGFMDGTAKGSFQLRRAALASAGVRTRDVSFQDKDVTLAGTLVLPAAAGRHPAVLFLQGSGPEGRWANHYLAQKFAERGIVALIYDKRGVGASTGDWHGAGFDALADDAAAGLALLRTQPEVDAGRVGIYGHSQGGTIAPLVYARSGGLAFIIASAAGGIDPADVEAYSVGNSMGIPDLKGAERTDAQKYLDTFIGTAYRGKPRAPLDALALQFKARDWYFAPPPPGDPYWALSRQIAAFKPADHWRLVKAPVLLVYGTLDARVPPQPSISAIQAALAAGGERRATVRLIPGADHSFTLASSPGGWPRHVPDYADGLATWVLAQH